MWTARDDTQANSTTQRLTKKPAEASCANGRADFYVSNQDIRIFAQLWVIGEDFCVRVPIVSDSCKAVVQKLWTRMSRALF